MAVAEPAGEREVTSGRGRTARPAICATLSGSGLRPQNDHFQQIVGCDVLGADSVHQSPIV